jgi:hypothetical protein
MVGRGPTLRSRGNRSSGSLVEYDEGLVTQWKVLNFALYFVPRRAIFLLLLTVAAPKMIRKRTKYRGHDAGAWGVRGSARPWQSREWLVMRTENQSSARYADQSNHC